MVIFKIVGVIGLLLISLGVITKKRRAQDILYILGGFSLLAYSAYIQDVIFVILQTIFIFSATYDFIKKR